MNALFLNCTLKKSPEISNTESFIKEAQRILNHLEVDSKRIRLADYNIPYGTSSHEGGDDEWPEILNLVKEADILILATPIWRGDRSSIAKKVAERFDGVTKERAEGRQQYPTYNKVAGVMVDGNEDGAKNAISSILLDLSEQGFTIPVNAFSYYVGKAGPGPSYIEAKAHKHTFTNKMLLMMLHNLIHLAKVLNESPYPLDLEEIEKQAEQMDHRKVFK